MSMIDDKYTELGGQSGFLGPPQSDEGPTWDGIGRYRRYANGSIYWHPRTGAHEVHGAIFAKWAGLNWEAGFGYPTSDETTGPDGVVRFNHFERGSIYWRPFDSPSEGGPGRRWEADAYNVGQKFNATRRNDGGTMAGHLKMYKDRAIVFGVALEVPHVNFPPNAERTYENFICAPWWYRKECALAAEPGQKDCDQKSCYDDPPDGDLDFLIEIDPSGLAADFWTSGFDFGDGGNRPSQIQAKLADGGNVLRVEVIMYGRSQGCGEGRAVNLPLLPGWAETGVSSVQVNATPIDGQLTFGASLCPEGTQNMAYYVPSIRGRVIGPGTMIMVEGFLALDCHGSCHEDDFGEHNVEIHPAYAVEVLGKAPCFAQRRRVGELLSALAIMERKLRWLRAELAVASLPGQLQYLEQQIAALAGEISGWHDDHDDELAFLRTQLRQPNCVINWSAIVSREPNLADRFRGVAR